MNRVEGNATRPRDRAGCAPCGSTPHTCTPYTSRDIRSYRLRYTRDTRRCAHDSEFHFFTFHFFFPFTRLYRMRYVMLVNGTNHSTVSVHMILGQLPPLRAKLITRIRRGRAQWPAVMLSSLGPACRFWGKFGRRWSSCVQVFERSICARSAPQTATFGDPRGTLKSIN
jgi:hypothetical protein